MEAWAEFRRSGFPKMYNLIQSENADLPVGTFIKRMPYPLTEETNNLEEFKSLFKTQEKACYELRSENTVLKMKLEVANEMIKQQSNKIQSLINKIESWHGFQYKENKIYILDYQMYHQQLYQK